MPANDTQFYSQQYTTAVELLAQQATSRLIGACTPETAVGTNATVVNFIDAIEADERTTRYDDIVPGDPTEIRPYVFPRHFDKAVYFETIDQMQSNANAKSEHVQNLVNSIRRKQDDEIISKFFATRMLGQGTTADAFAAANQVSVDVGGTASGMNVQKLQKVLELFATNEINVEGADDAMYEEVFVCISPKQKTNLMDEIEVSSGDFFRAEVMRTGRVQGFLSLNFIVSNRLQTDASGYRRCPVWTRKGMTFCTWDGGIKTDVSQRKDKRGLPWQAYVEGHFGSVRRDAKRVFEVKCAES